MSIKHPQVIADLGPGHRQTYVDEKLKPILEKLNKNGFKTQNSCQDNHGKIWIQFNPISSWTKLMEKALFDHLDQNEFQRIHGQEDNYETLWGFISDWVKYTVNYDEPDLSDEDEFYERTGGFSRNYILNESISIRFPKEMLSKFEQFFDSMHFGNKN